MKIIRIPRATDASAHKISSIADGRIADTIQRALTSAGLTIGGTMVDVNHTIKRALSSTGIVTDEVATKNREPLVSPKIHLIKPVAAAKEAQRRSARIIAPGQPGEFVSRSHSNAAGTRAYKLYVPETYTDKPMPLIVMLHGCTQSPDDFAAGTRMNRLADKGGFLVAYPAQSTNANGSRCWNWFNPRDQVPDRGEPSLIAGITREVASLYPVDEGRIFVAGLSAGAAMAVILGATYPELFAAVGVHSGLPYSAAYDVPSAFAAMRGSTAPISDAGNRSRTPTPQTRRHVQPTIVFHGDQDAIVNAVNGNAIVAQAIAHWASKSGPLTRAVQERKTVNGREYTATFYRDSALRPLVEEWVLHGAGHAWSGGCSDGSFTDVTGPDASAEMIRFFLAQREIGQREAG
jgi:poly(hydroxyalkanoate) depolymerase family esterase